MLYPAERGGGQVAPGPGLWVPENRKSFFWVRPFLKTIIKKTYFIKKMKYLPRAPANPLGGLHSSIV